MKHFLGARTWAVAAAAICVIALGLALPRYWQSASVAPAPPEATVPPQLLAGSQDGAQATPQPSTGGAEVVVYVCGAVKKSGVYRFAAGKRVIDAVARAGGATANADLEQLNLADLLTDAMKVDVPLKGAAAGESPRFSPRSYSAGSRHARSRGRANARGSRGHHKLEPGQTLDVNTATAEDLTALPGVGPGLAQRIIAYREQYGPFQTVDDLQNVSGIGPSKFEKLEPYVRL